MAHTIKQRKKLLDRVGRIAGQIDAVKRALDAEKDCGEVLRLIAASRGAMDSLMAEVLEGHLREHALSKGSKEAEAVDDVIAVVRAYLK